MANVNIGRLNLTVNNASGHEHRIAPIAERAASILATRLDQRLGGLNKSGPHLSKIEGVAASAVDMNLGTMSNEDVASAIANSWLQSLVARLKL